MMREFREAAATLVRGGEVSPDRALADFIQNVVDLDAALEMGFTVTLDDVNALEFRALVILRDERAKAVETKRRMEAASAASQRLQTSGF